MVCLLKTVTGELRVLADYSVLCAELRATADDDWIEVQEEDAVQTRHLLRRSSILHVVEMLGGPSKPISARILE